MSLAHYKCPAPERRHRYFHALPVILPEDSSLLPTKRKLYTQEEEVGDRCTTKDEMDCCYGRLQGHGEGYSQGASINGLIPKQGAVSRSAISKSVLSTMTVLAAARYSGVETVGPGSEKSVYGSLLVLRLNNATLLRDAAACGSYMASQRFFAATDRRGVVGRYFKEVLIRQKPGSLENANCCNPLVMDPLLRTISSYIDFQISEQLKS